MVSTARDIHNLALVGFMGTGKSLVGKVLEQKTGFRRFDTDEIISSKLKMPIKEIFSTHGEEHFRDLETEALRSMSPEEPAIIVTGGGVVLRAENIDLLRQLGTVVWLDADETTLRLVYARGRVNSGGGGLESVPIVDFRGHWDNNPDIHDRVRSLMTRERLIAANGHADNQVLLLTATLGAIFLDLGSPDSPWNRLVPHAVLQMERWLDNIANDHSNHSKAEKVIRNKPADLVDACFTADGQEIQEPATASPTSRCNRLYPVHGNPRLAAGEPLANDVLKCRVRPVDARDYGQPLSVAQIARLKAAFPQGVCDYRARGVGQGEVEDTWLAYPRPGVAVKNEGDNQDR